MGNKEQRALRRAIIERNVNQAAKLAALRKQGKRPDTILHSARIIGIDPQPK